MVMSPLPALLASLLLLAPAVTLGQPTPGAPTVAARAPADDPLVEALRERVDRLRYELQHDRRDYAVHGERLVLGDTVARYYESQQFDAKWRDPARLDLLIASLFELLNDGLEPLDYHVEALQSYRTELRRRKALPVEEQVELELLATDAMMLGLYHLYLGKVDPEKLSSQWNFSSRPVSVERGFEALTQALDSGRIRETFERARPQHVWYQRGRERLKEYRALAATGGWPTVPDGPSLKPGMQDPGVPALRARLRVTRDLKAGGMTPPRTPAISGRRAPAISGACATAISGPRTPAEWSTRGERG